MKWTIIIIALSFLLLHLTSNLYGDWKERAQFCEIATEELNSYRNNHYILRRVNDALGTIDLDWIVPYSEPESAACSDILLKIVREYPPLENLLYSLKDEPGKDSMVFDYVFYALILGSFLFLISDLKALIINAVSAFRRQNPDKICMDSHSLPDEERMDSHSLPDEERMDSHSIPDEKRFTNLIKKGVEAKKLEDAETEEVTDTSNVNLDNILDHPEVLKHLHGFCTKEEFHGLINYVSGDDTAFNDQLDGEEYPVPGFGQKSILQSDGEESSSVDYSSSVDCQDGTDDDENDLISKMSTFDELIEQLKGLGIEEDEKLNRDEMIKRVAGLHNEKELLGFISFILPEKLDGKGKDGSSSSCDDDFYI